MHSLSYIPTTWGRAVVSTLYLESRGVHVPNVFIDINDGNHHDARVFAQIFYWHMPNKESGKPRLSVEHEGYLWLAKNHNEWYAETRIRATTVRKCLERLKKRNLIVYELHGFAGNKTPYIRLNWYELEYRVRVWQLAEAEFDKEPGGTWSFEDIAGGVEIPDGANTPDILGQGGCPVVSDPLLPNIIPNTETTTETIKDSMRGTDVLAPAPTPPAPDLPADDPLPSDTPTQPPKKTQSTFKQPDGWYDALRDGYKLHGGRNVKVCKMLLGVSKDNGYKDFNFDPPAALEEIQNFPGWYRRKYPGTDVPLSPEKLQSHFYAFRADIAARPPRPDEMTDAEIDAAVAATLALYQTSPPPLDDEARAMFDQLLREDEP